MNEVELKILEVNVDAVVKKLLSIGAKKIFEGDIQARYFDFPDGKLRNAGSVLRLEFELAFKKKSSDDESVKSQDETETIVSDIEAMKKILLNLGLIEKIGLNKHRVSYSLGKVHFEFDTFPGIPTFLEIEAHSIKEAKDWVEKLGFSIKDAKPWSGKEVLKHYGKENLLKP
jgi:adenylate cyclase class 2